MGLFNRKKKQVTSEVTDKLKKPLADSVTGNLRKAMEYLAYVLENDENLTHHVVTLVGRIDKDREGIVDSGFEEMNCAFIRASDASLCDMLMETGMRDDTFAKSIIAVSHALQFKKEELADFANELDDDVTESIAKGKIPTRPKKSKEKKKLFENMGPGMKGINLNDLMDASQEDIDKMIGDMLAEDEEDSDN